MKDLTALYEHLSSAYDEAMEQELWQLGSDIHEIKAIIEEFRAEKTALSNESIEETHEMGS